MSAGLDEDDFLSDRPPPLEESQLFRDVIDPPRLVGPLQDADLGKYWNVHGDCRYIPAEGGEHPGLSCEQFREHERSKYESPTCRRAVVAYLNGLIRKTPSIEPLIRSRLNKNWNVLTLEGAEVDQFGEVLNPLTVYKTWNGKPWRDANDESRPREYLAEEVLGYLGLFISWCGESDRHTRRMGDFGSEDREAFHLALRILLDLGFRTHTLKGIYEPPPPPPKPPKPTGEKEKALEILRGLTASAPAPYSTWIAEIAAGQPAEKSETARKKLARTYATRLIEDGAVTRDEDSLVSVA